MNKPLSIVGALIGLLWTPGSTVFAQSRAGGSQDKATTPNQFATQNYAVIDVSADQADGPVQAVELGEDNTVVYGFNNVQSLYVTNKWTAGQTQKAVTTVKPEQDHLPLSRPDNLSSVYDSAASHIPDFRPDGSDSTPLLKLDGTVWSQIIRCAQYDPNPTSSQNNYAVFATFNRVTQCSGGSRDNVTLPDSNLLTSGNYLSSIYIDDPWPVDDVRGFFVKGVSNAGYFGSINSIFYLNEGADLNDIADWQTYGRYNTSGYETPDTHPVGYQVAGGLIYLFDSAYDDDGPTGDNIQGVALDYKPQIANDQGQTIGEVVQSISDPSVNHTYYWPYPSFHQNLPAPPGVLPTDLGQGYPYGLSNEGRVIIHRAENQGNRAINKGQLWEQRGTTDLVSVLASTDYKGFDSVDPLLISNENPTDHSYYLVTQIDDGKDYHHVLWKHNPSATDPNAPKQPEWSLYEIKVPDNMDINWGSFDVINSSGVIAAIGNSGKGDNHALLLVPVLLSSTYAKNSPKSFGKATPEDPNVHIALASKLAHLDQWVKQFEALIIFYDKVYDPNEDEIRDFTVDCLCGLAPSSKLKWVKKSGPDSGDLDDTGNGQAEYNNPKIGGLYKFDLKMFADNHVGTQMLLPLAGAEMGSWLKNEINQIGPWEQRVRAQAEKNCYSRIPGVSTYKLFLTWLDICNQFDYTLSPVNKDGSAPTKCFSPFDGAFRYLTVNGVVVFGSKIDAMLWAMFGRNWGYSENELKLGAHCKEFFTRYQLDSPTSQLAVQLGCDLYEAINSGGSEIVDNLFTADNIRALQTDDLIDKKLWPSKDAYDPTKSEFERPPLPFVVQ